MFGASFPFCILRMSWYTKASGRDRQQTYMEDAANVDSSADFVIRI